MMPVVYHPEAQDEFADAARYYEVRQSGLGERFRKLVQQIESDISANPETGFTISKPACVWFANFPTE